MLGRLRCTEITCCFFFFKDTATTEIYTLSLHDALPIYVSFISVTRILPALPPLLKLGAGLRSEEHTSELQSHHDLVCRLLLEKNTSELQSHHDLVCRLLLEKTVTAIARQSRRQRALSIAVASSPT